MYLCLFFDKWMLETNCFCLCRHRDAEFFSGKPAPESTDWVAIVTDSEFHLVRVNKF